MFAICFWIWFLWTKETCARLYFFLFLHLPYPRAHTTKNWTLLFYFFIDSFVFCVCCRCRHFFSIRAKNWRRSKKKIYTRLWRLQHTNETKRKKNMYNNENENRNNTRSLKAPPTYNRVWMFCVCAHFNTCNSRNRSLKSRLSFAIASNAKHSKPAALWQSYKKIRRRIVAAASSQPNIIFFLVLAEFYLHVCKAIIWNAQEALLAQHTAHTQSSFFSLLSDTSSLRTKTQTNIWMEQIKLSQIWVFPSLSLARSLALVLAVYAFDVMERAQKLHNFHTYIIKLKNLCDVFLNPIYYWI